MTASVKKIYAHWRNEKQKTGKIFFVIAVIYCLTVLSFKAHAYFIDLDSSIVWAANVYKDYHLEMGKDIVHVFGPLGWLYYPGAIHGHLPMAWGFYFLLHLLLIGGVIIFAGTTKEYLPAAFFLLVFSMISPKYLEEFHAYTILLAYYLIDFRLQRYFLWVIPSILSAIFFFVKFNLTISVTLMVMAYALIHGIQKQYLKALGIGLVFLGVVLFISLFQFTSIINFWNWMLWSFHIAAGNSEAMSLPAETIELISALAVLGIMMLIMWRIWEKSEIHTASLWSALVIILFYFVFKHGFVRADHHIYHFFLFAPVLAVSGLLLCFSRRIGLAVILILLISVVGPSYRYSLIKPNIPFQGVITALKYKKYFLKNWEAGIPANISSDLFTDEERNAVGKHTVNVLPSSVSLIYKTDLQWSPCPFFQLFLVRDPYMDQINASHIRSCDAADFLFYYWSAEDDYHPLHIAPASQLSIAECYAPFMTGQTKLLLKKKNRKPLLRQVLLRTHANWEEPITVPDSNDVVLAKIKIRYTMLGKLLKGLMWVPPVSIELDGKQKYRMVPSTAMTGLIVGHLPRDLSQFAYWIRTGRPHKDSAKPALIRIGPRPALPYFEDTILLEFEAITYP